MDSNQLEDNGLALISTPSFVNLLEGFLHRLALGFETSWEEKPHQAIFVRNSFDKYACELVSVARISKATILLG